MTTARTTNVDLRDLPYWLDRHGLAITSTRIVGELEGQLWIEATTRCSTATIRPHISGIEANRSDVATATPGEASSQPRRGRRGGTT